MKTLLFGIFLTPFLQAWAFPVSSGWHMEGTRENAQAYSVLKTLKEQAECDDSTGLLTILANYEVLEDADANRRQNFICKVHDSIDIENKVVENDREFMLDYMKKKEAQPESLSEKDHLKMLERLIKYRLLRNDKLNEYRVVATSYRYPKETKERIKELARQYFEQKGPPEKCFFVVGNFVKSAGLNDPKCVDEVNHRVQEIPANLILTQAVLESGWGSSELAREQNNILGLQIKFKHPETMGNYPNCRPARKAPSRCLLKFNDYGGSVYEYFSRFNASHFGGYVKYRKNRLDLYTSFGDMPDCEKSFNLAKQVHFYAENKQYVPDIKNMLAEVCAISETCKRRNIVLDEEAESGVSL